MMVLICVEMICKSMTSVWEGSSSINDEMSMWCELLNLFQLSYVAKLRNNVKLVLLVSFLIEYECLDLDDFFGILLLVSLMFSKVLSVIRGRMFFYAGEIVTTLKMK